MIALLINLNFELLSYSDQPGGKSLQHLVYEISHFSQGFLEIFKELFTPRRGSQSYLRNNKAFVRFEDIVDRFVVTTR